MVTITETAAGKVLELLQTEAEGAQGLRLFVSGGGCAGYSYGMAFDNDLHEGDAVQEAHGVRLLIDSESAPLLDGAEIDYIDSIQGSGFTIHNPNAVKSCSCGHSFNTSGDGVASHC